MKRRTLLIAAFAAAGCTDAAAPPPLVVTDIAAARGGGSGATTLPSFGGGAVAEAINDAGMVVGVAGERNPSRDVAGASYPTKWVRNGDGAWVVSKLTEISGGRALALNEAGDAVGYRFYDAGVPLDAIVWPAAGGEVSLLAGVARGINNAGIIVGGDVYGGSRVAYVWTPTPGSPSPWTRSELPLLESGGTAEAMAINNHSVISGAATRGGLPRAVVWLPLEGGGWSAPIPRDGTEPSEGTSAGFAINDDGDVAGYSRACSPQICGSRPYLWPAGGGSVALASSISNVNGGIAWGIANGGRSVGTLHVTRGPGGGPFVWIPADATLATGTLTDLGSGEASDINNPTASYGQEAVGSTFGSRVQTAVVWRIQ